ncbi:MAG: EAL domain-containing protein [Rhodoferax sp.]|nr:EAL domain-containing protein [Rhodoferax sp.]
MRPNPLAALTLVLGLLISTVVVWQMQKTDLQAQRNRLYNQASDHASAIQNNLDRALSAVYAMATLVQQGRGHINNFDQTARRMLPYYPGVSILILAPGGVISHAVPLAGNEKAIGLDLLKDPVMRAETQLARNTGQLTLAGPLPLRQGGLGLVARLPIFLEDATSLPVFWGFTNVVLRLPQALDSARLSELAQRNLAYRLWRINPETGQQQVIAESGPGALMEPVDKSFDVPNGAWTISVAPSSGWDNPVRLTTRLGLGWLTSLLLAYLVKLQMRQMASKADLERQVAERTNDIRASQMQLAATLQAIPDLLFEIDIDGRFITYHAPRSSLLMVPVESLIGKTVHQVLPELAAQTVLQAVQDAQRDQVSYGKQLELPLPQGARWFELSVACRSQAAGQRSSFIVISHDITDRVEAEHHVRQLAYFDVLTGLPNRSLLQERIHQAVTEAGRRQEHLCVMFLDIDHFKNINDTLGHRVGDQLLVEVARRMQATVRAQDTVARLGGDEFIILLPDTSARGAARVTDKLLQAVSLPVKVVGHDLSVTASIGVAIYPEDGSDAGTLQQHADVAMYRAKSNGRNGYQFFINSMQADAARTLLLDNELRRALARHQLHLDYQPQVSMATGQVVGVEALLRWTHPKLGRISPIEFIPIAEGNGQILPIGEWVLRSALQQATAWAAADLPSMTVAVNLSAVQFRQPHLVQRVATILQEEGVPAGVLKLELTESVAQQDPEGAMIIMEQLHLQGVQLSIDDFGTGYSSLSYLKRFKVNQLKIDQSFVQDITHDADDLAIVSAIISMARSLGLTTIAEGVETQQQLAVLRQLGCAEIQGYLYCKPLPAGEIEACLRAWPTSAQP